ncbi:MAG: hypothetical protein ACI83Y_002891 [Candidatus Azotimanducaceae bacterium]
MNLIPVCMHRHHKIDDEGWVIELGRRRALTLQPAPAAGSGHCGERGTRCGVASGPAINSVPIPLGGHPPLPDQTSCHSENTGTYDKRLADELAMPVTSFDDELSERAACSLQPRSKSVAAACWGMHLESEAVHTAQRITWSFQTPESEHRSHQRRWQPGQRRTFPA